MDIALIKEKAFELFKEITNHDSGDRTFEIPEIYKLMEELKCEKVSGSSGKKSDLTLCFYNPDTGRQSSVGFSIKSELGGSPSLINASATTNIIYSVNFPDSVTEAIILKTIEENDGTKSLIQALTALGAVLNFKKYSNEIFRKNLMNVESTMPIIIASLVLRYNNEKKISKLKEIANKFVNSGEALQILNMPIDQSFIERNLKELLRSSALGMNPGVPWNGDSSAYGGYILVKKNGEVLVESNSDNRDILGTHLYEIARLDNGSRSKHGFGVLEKNSDGSWEIKMNFSIRIG